MTELAKYITVPVAMEFMVLSSYGNEQTSSGEVKALKDTDISVEGKNVLIVEDIIDTGRTMHHLKHLLSERHPASLAICAMLDKPDRRVVEVQTDYTGFTIEDKFVLGYGLDYEQYYRNLRYIAYVE
jgi:hypoxanthine phosphoribosyltransferase